MVEEKIGFDTGFFIKALQADETALNIWKKIKNNETAGYVSSLSLFEIKRLTLKGAIDKKSSEILLNDISISCHIVWIDNMDIIDSSAKISYSNNIPAIDSIILASLLNVGVIRIYTTDTDLQKYRKKIISIILL